LTVLATLDTLTSDVEDKEAVDDRGGDTLLAIALPLLPILYAVEESEVEPIEAAEEEGIEDEEKEIEEEVLLIEEGAVEEPLGVETEPLEEEDEGE
jgi:hypothetical protein